MNSKTNTDYSVLFGDETSTESFSHFCPWLLVVMENVTKHFRFTQKSMEADVDTGLLVDLLWFV